MNPELALVEYYRNALRELVDEALEEGIVLSAETAVDPMTASIMAVKVDAHRTVRKIEA